MIAFSNCKINIGLNIISKRNDGFHNIESVLYPVNLCDILEINLRSNLKDDSYNFQNVIALITSGNSVDCSMEENLCYKAFQLIKNDYRVSDVVLHLHKIAPMGAGLGGGSANAAYTLKLLNQIFNLNIETTQLHNYASQLGSDCSFFINNQPAYATGKGDLLHPVDAFLKNYHITLVKPPIHISTAEAYKSVTPVQPTVSLLNLIAMAPDSWRDVLFNDFEKPVFKNHPQLQEIKNSLYDAGCLYASMSGSGSCIYGISQHSINISGMFENCFTWQGILS